MIASGTVKELYLGVLSQFLFIIIIEFYSSISIEMGSRRVNCCSFEIKGRSI